MPVNIFLCYAREDELLRQGLEKQLRILRRQSLIEIWHDREIGAGTDWEREITKHLNTADIILLLVSPDFMDSDYCYGIEMQRAMERHERGEALVIPVILRPVYWQSAPFGKLQALPTDAIPVSSSKWHNLDEAFFDIAEGIRKEISKLNAQTLKATEQEPLNSSHATLSPDFRTNSQLDEAPANIINPELPDAEAKRDSADADTYPKKGERSLLPTQNHVQQTTGTEKDTLAQAYINPERSPQSNKQPKPKNQQAAKSDDTSRQIIPPSSESKKDRVDTPSSFRPTMEALETTQNTNGLVKQKESEENKPQTPKAREVVKKRKTPPLNEGREVTVSTPNNSITPPLLFRGANEPVTPSSRKSVITAESSLRIPSGEKTTKFSPIFHKYRAILIIGLVIFILLSSVVIFSTSQIAIHTHTNQANTSPTASATATQVAEFHPTPVPPAPDPYPPNKGSLDLYDSFIPSSNGNYPNDNGWDVTEGLQQCYFKGGAYHATSNCSANRDFCCYNLAYEVQMEVVRGSGGGISFLYPIGNVKAPCSTFKINTDGSYLIQGLELSNNDNGHSSVIKTGLGQSNTIAMVQNDGTISFYVNHKKIYSDTSNTACSPSYVGVFAGDGSTEVVFHNAKVWPF